MHPCNNHIRGRQKDEHKKRHAIRRLNQHLQFNPFRPPVLGDLAQPPPILAVRFRVQVTGKLEGDPFLPKR